MLRLLDICYIIQGQTYPAYWPPGDRENAQRLPFQDPACKEEVAKLEKLTAWPNFRANIEAKEAFVSDWYKARFPGLSAVELPDLSRYGTDKEKKEALEAAADRVEKEFPHLTNTWPVRKPHPNIVDPWEKESRIKPFFSNYKSR